MHTNMDICTFICYTLHNLVVIELSLQTTRPGPCTSKRECHSWRGKTDLRLVEEDGHGGVKRPKLLKRASEMTTQHKLISQHMHSFSVHRDNVLSHLEDTLSLPLCSLLFIQVTGDSKRELIELMPPIHTSHLSRESYSAGY